MSTNIICLQNWLENLKKKRFAFEKMLCGYKPGEPIGSVEGAARDEGGEWDEVFTPWVHKRLRPSVKAWRAAKSKDKDKGQCASSKHPVCLRPRLLARLRVQP